MDFGLFCSRCWQTFSKMFTLTFPPAFPKSFATCYNFSVSTSGIDFCLLANTFSQRLLLFITQSFAKGGRPKAAFVGSRSSGLRRTVEGALGWCLIDYCTCCTFLDPVFLFVSFRPTASRTIALSICLRNSGFSSSPHNHLASMPLARLWRALISSIYIYIHIYKYIYIYTYIYI